MWVGRPPAGTEIGTAPSPTGIAWSGERLPKRVLVPHSTNQVVAARLGSIRAVSRAEVGVLSVAERREMLGTVGLAVAAVVLNVASAPFTSPATSR